ncbi:MAG: uroporphyrinogen decarboxylase family protein [Desulfobacterales bacterium]|nr:uroporphyrinogen decarboxylase family protein [Desulfobacterales bacterium]
MAKKLLIDATRGQQTAMPPWLPYAGVHCAKLIDTSAEQFLKDPALLAEGVVHAARLYHADGIPLLFDLSVEAHALGCDLAWWEDNVPSVTTHPCQAGTPLDVDLEMFSRDSGRWPVIFEAAHKAKPQLDELDCAMLGLVSGPLTLASHLAGPQIFTALLKRKEYAHAVLEFAGEAGAQAARFYAEMGCAIIAIVDPVASQVRPQTFREFVTPNCQPALEVIHADNLTSTFFICGDCSKVLEEVCQVGTHGFAVDEQVNLGFVRDMAHRYGKGFGGNLKLTSALMLGMIDPKTDALISLAAGGNHGYTFAPG